jgi:uncharacterized protein YlxW (UPF0749 family)
VEDRRKDRPLVWRLVGVAGFALAGVLLTTSALEAGGTDLRDAGFDDLRDLVSGDAKKLAELRTESADLRDEIDLLTAGLSSKLDDRAQRRLEALRDQAGMTAVQGPGVTVTLNDAPPEIRDSVDIDVSQLIVHQQDIQAVVNALWAGGAEAISIQNRRLISTTGIKCVGNSVILDGVPYSPPYVIKAVGDPVGLVLALGASDYLNLYLAAVEVYQLGWNLESSNELVVPAYADNVELRYARAAGTDN